MGPSFIVGEALYPSSPVAYIAAESRGARVVIGITHEADFPGATFYSTKILSHRCPRRMLFDYLSV
jgi:hypothetical protein